MIAPKRLCVGDRVRARLIVGRAGRQTITFTVFRVDPDDGKQQTCYASARNVGTIKIIWNVGNTYQYVRTAKGQNQLDYAGRGKDADVA